MQLLTRKLSNHVAGMILFSAWYLTATTTILFIEGFYSWILPKTALVYLAVMAFMTLVFALSRLLKRTDVVDAAWGPALAVASITSFMLNPYGVEIGWNAQTIATGLVIIWAARLSYLIIGRLRKKPEDARYVELRKKWKGNEALNTFGRIFMTQAVLASTIALAVIHINLSVPEPVTYFVVAGGIIWLIGLLFEAIGDYQLKRHLANPKNKGTLMTKGLWQYTRHPNYFGESLLWWGIFVIALATSYGWVGIVTPVVITYLLLFVSGVPTTEKAFARKSGWTAYKKRTSKFFPLLPRH